MLEQYFIRPSTVDRIRASWIGDPIERYVGWLHEGGYARSTVTSWVPVLVGFGEFARGRGARTWSELPAHVPPFVAFWPQRHGVRVQTPTLTQAERRVRGIVEGMLQCALPEFERAPRWPQLPVPFAREVPGFFPYLRSERGLREAAVQQYLHYIRRFERYLAAPGRPGLRDLQPEVLREFIARAGAALSSVSMNSQCGCLRVFLRYLYREELLERDLSRAVEHPRTYRLDRVPRSIPWPEAQRLLAQVDRRGAAGRRDYAMLLLLLTYGLRACEVAALRLEDIDWRSGVLRVAGRKAGHSTRYRLTTAVGEALLDYLEHVRPQVEDRHVFLTLAAPVRPAQSYVVSDRVRHWVEQAGISAPRAGAHTLRHTVVQRLLDHEIPLQQIGHYVGHRSVDATQIYTKVDMAHLREIALGDGEEVWK